MKQLVRTSWHSTYQWADSISAKNATAEDQNINSAWATQVKEYAAGNKDKDTAIADFKSAVHDSYSYLKAE